MFSFKTLVLPYESCFIVEPSAGTIANFYCHLRQMPKDNAVLNTDAFLHTVAFLCVMHSGTETALTPVLLDVCSDYRNEVNKTLVSEPAGGQTVIAPPEDRSKFPVLDPGSSVTTVLDTLSAEELCKVVLWFMERIPERIVDGVWKKLHEEKIWVLIPTMETLSKN